MRHGEKKGHHNTCFVQEKVSADVFSLVQLWQIYFRGSKNGVHLQRSFN